MILPFSAAEVCFFGSLYENIKKIQAIYLIFKQITCIFTLMKNAIVALLTPYGKKKK